jgi:hypothetical protein
MKLIYQTSHDGVIGQVIEPDDMDASRPYAEQLQVKIGVDEQGKQLTSDDFEPRARLFVLELRNFLRDVFGMTDPPIGASNDAATAAVETTQNGQTESPVQSRRMPPETLIHTSKGARWRIDVHRPQGVTDPEQCVVFLTGNMDGNVYRSRNMALEYFLEVVRGMEHARRTTPELLAAATDVPMFPKSLTHELARAELFYITIALSRVADGCIEPTLALYDAEDDAAPVLMAIDEEIGELCRDCAAAIAAAETLE